MSTYKVVTDGIGIPDEIFIEADSRSQAILMTKTLYPGNYQINSVYEVN